MATKNNPGAFDCNAKAEPDEPLFVLLGRDKHAATLVRIWALLRNLEGEPDEVVEEAMQTAQAMNKYRLSLGKPLIYADHEAYGRVEPIFMALTKGMSEHPNDFDEPCDCDTCRSYADDDGAADHGGDGGEG